MNKLGNGWTSTKGARTENRQWQSVVPCLVVYPHASCHPRRDLEVLKMIMPWNGLNTMILNTPRRLMFSYFICLILLASLIQYSRFYLVY